MKRSLRRLSIVLVLILAISGIPYAYEVSTHDGISVIALKSSQSNVPRFLKEELVLPLGVNTTCTSADGARPLFGWVGFGAQREDDDARCLNHFYNPLRNEGLTDPPGLGLVADRLGLPHQPAPLWAWKHDSNVWSWTQARDYYYRWLTEFEQADREQNCADMFRSLGQVAHLIQDMAQPQHTRNDLHFHYQLFVFGFPIDLGTGHSLSAQTQEVSLPELMNTQTVCWIGMCALAMLMVSRAAPGNETSESPKGKRASPASQAHAERTPQDIPKFGIFEHTFTQRQSYANPYTEVTATATFIQPDGRARSIPLFWDGGAVWKVRFSPDVPGSWSWSVCSNDPGLNGVKGAFRCVSSTHHGGIMAMTGYPYHFQYQDGTPYWLCGDTQWESFADDPAQGLNARSMKRYFTLRAKQGFNYVHTEIIGLVRASNIAADGRENPAFHDYLAETINPAYFQEVDAWLRQANAVGITLGMILMEPYFTPPASIEPAYRYDNRCWMSFPDEAARLRYARYVVARYSAFNILFLLTLEWGPAGKPIPRNDCIAMFNRIGTEIQNHDPHHRLRGIHDDNGTLPNDFYGSASRWNTLGQYAQYSGSDYGYPWCDDCTPPNDQNCRGRFATPRNRQTLHDEMLEVRVNRKHNRPVIDGEYAYYLRRGMAAHPKVVNRGHSHDRPTFRKAAWVLTMAGTYIVPGFWRTYYGGWAGRNTPFRPDDPEALPAVKDLQTFHTFFTQREGGARRPWWKLVPDDKLVSSAPNPTDGSPGHSYCLADSGQSYIVYTENTQATELLLGRSPGATYRVTRFDPRNGKRALLDAFVKGGTTFRLLSPDTEDWVYEAEKN